MKYYKDQIGRSVNVKDLPRRIVSLVPSQTEFLMDSGIRERLIGITKFCVHPPDLKERIAVVGGTKKINMELLKSLKPDLVIANKEENLKEEIEEIERFTNVWVSNVQSELDAIQMMRSLSDLLRLNFNENRLTEKIALMKANSTYLGDVLYLIWRKPFMAAGNDTFINSMLELAGFNNCISNQNRYPIIELNDLVGKKPSHIFLSSEPYPFKEKHINEVKSYFPEANVLLVDGEMFSWYGSRIYHAVDYILDRFYKV